MVPQRWICHQRTIRFPQRWIFHQRTIRVPQRWIFYQRTIRFPQRWIVHQRTIRFPQRWIFYLRTISSTPRLSVEGHQLSRLAAVSRSRRPIPSGSNAFFRVTTVKRDGQGASCLPDQSPSVKEKEKRGAKREERKGGKAKAREGRRAKKRAFVLWFSSTFAQAPEKKTKEPPHVCLRVLLCPCLTYFVFRALILCRVMFRVMFRVPMTLAYRRHAGSLRPTRVR